MVVVQLWGGARSIRSPLEPSARSHPNRRYHRDWVTGMLEERLTRSRPATSNAELERCKALVRARVQGSSRLPRVGRYVLRSRIGRGGFGEVFLAEDETLQRTVAIKLLRRGPGIRAPSTLVEEARAMARLSHPNVVAVHDVGEHEGETFLVMDYVQGETLGGWLAEAPRRWEETAKVLVRAGRGLAAAHRAGLVHRDFKPGNVLVAEVPVFQVQVTDFGLSASQSGITLGRPVGGTRGYLAPEVEQGAAAGPAADQFAFCLTFSQALATATGRVPRRITAALRRGLESHPSRRWPDMPSLLGELETVLRNRTRVRRGVLLVSTVALVSAGFTGALLVPEDADPCLAAAEESVLRAEAAAPRIASVFAKVAPQLGPAIWADATARLHADAESLTAARIESCAAVQERPTAEVRRRHLCLEQRAWEFGALLDVLERADLDVVEHATEAIAQLTPPATCDTPTPQRPLPSGEEVLATLEVRRALARARALQHAGRYEDALSAATEAQRLAQAADYAPVVAEASFRRGLVFVALEDHEAAMGQLRAALAASHAGRDPVMVVWSTALLAQVAGGYLGDEASGRAWFEAARAGLAGVVAPPELDDAVHEIGAHLAAARGDYPEAIVEAEAVLARREVRLPEDDLRLGNTRTMLGNLYYRSMREDDAARIYAKVLEQRQRVLGPEHPETAVAHNNVGLAALAAGRHDDARQSLQRALEIWRGRSSVELAVSRARVNLALLDLYEGRPNRATAALLEIDGILAEEGPSATELRANVWALQGDASFERGDFDAAQEHYEAMARHWPSEHPQRMGVGYRLGRLAMERGDPQGAHVPFAAGLEAARRSYSPDSAAVLGLEAAAGLAAGLCGDEDGARAAVAAVASAAPSGLSEDAAAVRLDLARLHMLLGEMEAAALELAAITVPFDDVRDEALRTLLKAELEAAQGEPVDVEAVAAAMGGSRDRYAGRLDDLRRAAPDGV